MDFCGTHERPGTAAVMQDMGLAEGIRLILQNVKQSSQLIYLPLLVRICKFLQYLKVRSDKYISKKKAIRKMYYL